MRKHIASHIASHTTPGSVLMIDAKGALKSSTVTLDELAHVGGASSNIQLQLATKLDMKDASSTFQSKTTNDSMPLSSVMGLVTHVIPADAKASAMATPIADLEARTIVATHRVVLESSFDSVNMNARLVYHRS